MTFGVIKAPVISLQTETTGLSCGDMYIFKLFKTDACAVMHTCDLDWGRTVLLMLCVLLMLKLRLWEDVRDWVGAIKSNRSAEAGPDPGAETGVRLGPGAAGVAGPPVTAPKRSLPLLSTVWADAGIWPPGKAFHSPKSPLEAGATKTYTQKQLTTWAANNRCKSDPCQKFFQFTFTVYSQWPLLWF